MIRNVCIVFLCLLCVLHINAQSSIDDDYNCFTIIAGKYATEDGSVLVAHNEDDSGTQLVNLYKVPAKSYPEKSKVVFKHLAKESQVAKTYGYFWIEMPKQDFADSYMNEFGVTIVSNKCRSREEGGRITEGGIMFWLRRLMAERCKTALEAVELAGSLIEKFGYRSSGRTYCIADPNDAWVLSVVQGKHWVAQRLITDHIMVIPNYYVIGEVDLENKEKFRGSKDLVKYAIERKWYSPKKDGKFNFRKAYSNPNTLKSKSNFMRKWAAVSMLYDKKFKEKDEFPFSMRPKKRVNVADLIAVLRSHYNEIPNSRCEPSVNPHQCHWKSICDNSTQYSFVAQLRRKMPSEVGNVLWYAPFRPCLQAFTPWYWGVKDTPVRYRRNDHVMALKEHFNPPDRVFVEDPNHIFWNYVNFAKQFDSENNKTIKKNKKKKFKFEKRLFKKQKRFEKKALKLLEKDKNECIDYLTDYTNEQLVKSEKMNQ